MNQPWTAPVGGGSKNFKPAPQGNHIARCVSLIGLGTQTKNFQGDIKEVYEVRLTFALMNELMDDGRPFTVSRDFTLSMHEKAGLRLAIESWRGKKFTEDEAASFDVSKLLGQGCLVNVVHKENKKDPASPYANIGSITPAPKGMSIPPLKTETVIFRLDQYDQATFEMFGKKLREKIMSSPEWRELAAKGKARPKLEESRPQQNTAPSGERAPNFEEDPFEGVPVRDGNEEIDF